MLILNKECSACCYCYRVGIEMICVLLNGVINQDAAMAGTLHCEHAQEGEFIGKSMTNKSWNPDEQKTGTDLYLKGLRLVGEDERED